MDGRPTEDEIAMTLELYNSMHDNPNEHVLREHWDIWWDHPLPRSSMARYLKAARNMIRVARERGLHTA